MSNKAKSQSNSLKTQAQQFRQCIRRRELQTTISKMREELLITISEDYACLRDINLKRINDAFSKTDLPKDIDKIDSLVQQFFSYSISDQYEHMFELLGPSFIERLVDLLDCRRIGQFREYPRCYLRMLAILSRYTQYAETVPSTLLQFLK